VQVAVGWIQEPEMLLNALPVRAEGNAT